MALMNYELSAAEGRQDRRRGVMKIARMTKGEIETLQTILRLGGKVIPTHGSKFAANVVCTSIINSLRAKGYIRDWTDARRIGMRNGRYVYEHDLAVTAEGCRALATAEGC